MDDKLWQFEFGVEVSARYHEWRRDSYLAANRFVKASTFIGAVITLLVAFAPETHLPFSVFSIVITMSALIAVINLAALVWNIDDRTSKHIELFRRFKGLQAEIARGREVWKERLPDWEAHAHEIRTDEPPTMWAVYAVCWNQTIDRHQADRKGFYRPVGPIKSAFKNILSFSPRSFKPEA